MAATTGDRIPMNTVGVAPLPGRAALVATTIRMTLDEWLARPDTEPASEFVCGEAFQKPMPNLAHHILAGFVGHLVWTHARRLNLGLAGPELRCVFGPTSGERGHVPDVAFVSRERLPRGDARSVPPFRAAPDLAIEILSPDQEMGRFTEKIQFYLRHGVRLVWVVDPRAETVTVHRPDADPFTLGAGDVLDGGDVLPGFTLPVAGIFAELKLNGDEANE